MPPTLDGDGASEECRDRKGVLHALLTDSGLPDTERRVGVELIDGKCAGSSGVGAWLCARERLLRDDDMELDSEPEVEREMGLPEKPASVGSGMWRGEIWILATDDEGVQRTLCEVERSTWEGSKKPERATTGVLTSSSNSPPKTSYS